MSDQQKTPKRVWAGRILSGFSDFCSRPRQPQNSCASGSETAEQLAKMGIPKELLVPLGIIELFCVITYAIPQTSVLGAVLFTGYLGGAIFTHMRVSEIFVLQPILGILIWLGLYLREPWLAALAVEAKADVRDTPLSRRSVGWRGRRRATLGHRSTTER